MTNDLDISVQTDQPLQPGRALKDDKLGRKDFARSAVAVLDKIPPSSSLVLSIEGGWGSGKTSTLSMITEILQQKEIAPIVVHFNPWLVGDRDALLKLFLDKLAAAVNVSDPSKNGKKAAKELKAYSKIFDVVRLIPGAEPWASVVKAVLNSAGDATGAVAKLKALDIEAQKNRVEEALRVFQCPIIVFIDDIDRLFPLEVFEMVRIVKSVGDLPNVRYVLAWDPSYVVRALQSASVPQADVYLDKIVQVRMPLPPLSFAARETLINEALNSLHPDAIQDQFARGRNRLSELYFSGLRELFEQPRDIIRTFNVVAIIEPALRGEIVLSDVVGLAALIVKAHPVFEVLRGHPNWFVGRLPGDHLPGKNEDIIEEGRKCRESAYAKCMRPDAVRQIVKYLFPITEQGYPFQRISEAEGHLAAPARLLIALQIGISAPDVSLGKARSYLLRADLREDIANSLNIRNCVEFLEQLGEVAASMEGKGIEGLDDLSLAIARLVDRSPYPEHARAHVDSFLSSYAVAVRAISQVVQIVERSRAPSIAAIIIEDRQSLTVAMDVFVSSYLLEDRGAAEHMLKASADEKTKLTGVLTENILAAARDNSLQEVCDPGFLLWNLPRISPDACPGVFEALRRCDPTLDRFVLEFLRRSYDSHKGQVYALPKNLDELEAYCPLEDLRIHAKVRLADSAVEYPVKAAWTALLEDKALYGIDGSAAGHR